MASIDLSGLNIDQLTDLVGKAQSEMAWRERQRRKDLRSELERRLAAEGYKMVDIFPELRTSAANGRRRKMPAKFRNPQNPRRDLDRDRAVAEVGAGDPYRAGDRHGGVQGDPDVPSPCVNRRVVLHVLAGPVLRGDASRGQRDVVPARFETPKRLILGGSGRTRRPR